MYLHLNAVESALSSATAPLCLGENALCVARYFNFAVYTDSLRINVLLLVPLLALETVEKCVYSDLVCSRGFFADLFVDVEGFTLMIGLVRCLAAELIVAL